MKRTKTNEDPIKITFLAVRLKSHLEVKDNLTVEKEVFLLINYHELMEKSLKSLRFLFFLNVFANFFELFVKTNQIAFPPLCPSFQINTTKPLL